MLEDTDVASAADSVEEGVAGAVRNADGDGHASRVVRVELVASVADAADGVVVGVGGALRNLLASSSDVLGTLNADAGLESIVVPFVVVAVGSEVALDAVSVNVSAVAEPALAGNTVVGLVGAAPSAGSENPEVVVVAVALSVLEVSVDPAVLVAGAASVDDSVPGVANAAVGTFVPVTVERTNLGRSALSVDDGLAVLADALSVDVGRS